MQLHILAESTGAGILRAHIESSLAFMREHRNHLIAIVEIGRNGFTADGRPTYGGRGLPFGQCCRPTFNATIAAPRAAASRVTLICRMPRSLEARPAFQP